MHSADEHDPGELQAGGHDLEELNAALRKPATRPPQGSVPACDTAAAGQCLRRRCPRAIVPECGQMDEVEDPAAAR